MTRKPPSPRTLDRAREARRLERVHSARLGWETRRARAAARAQDVEQALGALGEIAGRLRETAKGLRAFQRHATGAVPIEGAEPIHPMHAANRLEQIAGQIDSSKGGK